MRANDKRKVGMSLVVFAALLLLCACQSAPPPAPEPTAEDYFNQGLRYFKAANYDSAIREFRMATAENPSYIQAYFYLGQCYEKKQAWDDAVAAYRECIKLDSQYLKAREALGVLYYDLQKYSQAREQLEAAKSLGSILPKVYFCLGEILRTDGDCKGAMAEYQRALQLDPAYVAAKDGLKLATDDCNRKYRKPQAPLPKKEKSFQGGGAAIEPGKF